MDKQLDISIGVPFGDDSIPDGATKAQIKKLKLFYRDLYLHDSHQSYKYSGDVLYHEYEYKKFEITISKLGTIWLVSEVGLVGDEGTMAAILGRTHRLISIGKRGGCVIHNARGKRKRFIEKRGYFRCIIADTS